MHLAELTIKSFQWTPLRLCELQPLEGMPRSLQEMDVSVGDGSQAAESGFVKTAVTKQTVICPRCGSDRPRRAERKKFFERHVYPFFGYFPWRCGHCKAKFLLRRRRRSPSSNRQDYVS